MWDGDQLLYELRQPGAAADNLDTSPYGGTSRFYGTVGYIHGRDLDRPLALHDSAGRVPIVDARGQYEGFLRPTGAGADCKTAAGAGCWTINWASKRTGAGFQTWGGSYPDVPDEWRGGLIQHQTDRAGLAYKRNRYYDPSTGRFTQVDPIGIAGGTNVYGFASGDPVNFSDPFGLDVTIGKEIYGSYSRLMAGSATAKRIILALHRNRNVDLRATGCSRSCPEMLVSQNDGGYFQANIFNADIWVDDKKFDGDDLLVRLGHEFVEAGQALDARGTGIACGKGEVAHDCTIRWENTIRGELGLAPRPEKQKAKEKEHP